jgi:hypothetical protein
LRMLKMEFGRFNEFVGTQVSKVKVNSNVQWARWVKLIRQKTSHFCGQISQATGMVESSGLFYVIDIWDGCSAELKVCKNLQPFFTLLDLNISLKNGQFFKPKIQTKLWKFFFSNTFNHF